MSELLGITVAELQFFYLFMTGNYNLFCVTFNSSKNSHTLWTNVMERGQKGLFGHTKQFLGKGCHIDINI